MHIFSGWKLGDHLELVLIYSDVLLVGLWLLSLARKWLPKIGFWYDIGYACSFGTTFYAMVGIIIITFPDLRFLFSWSCGVIAPAILLMSFYRNIGTLFQSIAVYNRLGIAIWLVFLHSTLCYSTLRINYPNPSTIPDGLVVFKQDRIFTRIQYIAGLLPCDNFIPFAVGECLMRGVPMQKDFLILPGQKVGNRPFFMAYIYIAFRELIKPEPLTNPKLPLFFYADSNWPNTFIFGSDSSYRTFLPVGIFFNGLLLICLFVLLEAFGYASLIPIAGIVLTTCPYILSQTMFAWPKSAAGFFILLAYTSVFMYSRPLVASLLLGGAYYCHPYALTYGIGFLIVVWFRLIFRSDRFVLKSWFYGLAVPFGIYMSILSPWIIWQQFSAGSNSDLIAQNFNVHHSIADQLLVRMSNLLEVLYNSRAQLLINHGYIDVYSWSFIFIVGIFFVPFFIWGTLKEWRRYFSILSAGSLSMILIVSVFSDPAFIIVHGTQPFAVLCFSISVVTLFETLDLRAVYILCLLQAALNLFVWLTKLYFLE